MKKLYTNMNMKFHVEGYELVVLNIVFEQFSRIIPRHSHGQNCYELHYIPNGCGTVIVDGKTFRITPNTLYITGPHIEHEQIPEKENPMAEYCIYFKILHGNPKSTGMLMKLFRETPFWFGSDTQDINTTMHMIFHELDHNYIGFMTQVVSLLEQCIVKLVRNYERNRKSQSQFERSSLVNQKYIITEEYFLYEYQTLSLQVLANLLGLSTRQTNRFLKDCYGKNFQQKKTEAKMSVAAALLSDPALSISHIAAESGYSSLEHFVNAFKKYYGMTTKEYRERTFFH